MKTIMIFFLFPMLVNGQGDRINFVSNADWNSVLGKAKESNKYIFVDCYATWCGPCKFMNDSIFSKQRVADYFNKHFLNVKLQMDSTAKDDSAVKSIYAMAHTLRERYGVNAFPTYLFFTPDGRVVHKAIGSVQNASQFIEEAEDAMDASRQYYTILSRYREGTKDSILLRQLAIEAHGVGDDSLARQAWNAYLQVISHFLTKDNLALTGTLTKHSIDPGFLLFLHNTAKVDTIMGRYYAERKIMNIIMTEDENIAAINERSFQGFNLVGYISGQPQYVKDANKGNVEPPEPDWLNVERNILDKYGPYYADRIVKWMKVSYFYRRENWSRYSQSAIDYVASYQDDINLMQLNSYAWDIFLHIHDTNVLRKALQWSKLVISENENGKYEDIYLDTYANLLYKMGQTGSAIHFERKAIEKATEDNKMNYKATVEKMKKGYPTWVENN